MKTTLIISIVAAGALSTAFAAENKSITDRTFNSLEKAGDKTVETSKSALTKSKNAMNRTLDAITPDSDAEKIDVKLNDKKLDMPASLHPGKKAFVVHNGSKESRNFELQGEGIDKKFMIGLSPNETKTLHVDLKRGSFKALSPEKDGGSLKADLTVK
jgi:predicted outer membrane protein